MKQAKKRGKYGQYNRNVESNMGAPTTLTDEILQQIRAMVLDGKSSPEIYETLGIAHSTWSTWRVRNHLDFASLLNQWQQEYIVKTAQEELSKLVKDNDSRIKLDALKFALERLNKKDFSVRQETKALPVDEKLEQSEQDRLNDLLKDNKKEVKQESNGEPITTYKEVVVK